MRAAARNQMGFSCQSLSKSRLARISCGQGSRGRSPQFIQVISDELKQINPSDGDCYSPSTRPRTSRKEPSACWT